MRLPARMDGNSLWLWVLAMVGATVLTWLELREDPTPPAPAGDIVEFEVAE